MRLTSHTLNEYDDDQTAEIIQHWAHPNHLTLPHWEQKYYNNEAFYSKTQSEIQCTNK